VSAVVNALSFDVESFVESNVESFHIPQRFRDERDQAAEVERNMRSVFDLLADRGVRATFFFLGTVARRSPQLVAEAARLGHEVAAHGDDHRRLFGMDPEGFRATLRQHKEELESLAGVEIHGFRAPEFSITPWTRWALDVVREVGFTYDSSIYPTGIHDVYGFPGAAPHVHLLENGMAEFPPPTARFLGRRVPFGGGGYFRIAPARVTQRLVVGANTRGEPVILWLHPYEVGPAAPRIPHLSIHRQVRHYANLASGPAKLKRLLADLKLGRAVDVLRERRLVRV
jgi:polysaccharide deacetylase family protein (PEP-CTERM system associated)